MSYLIAVVFLAVLLSGAAVLIAIARLVEILPPLGGREEDVRGQVREAPQHRAARSASRQLLR